MSKVVKDVKEIGDYAIGKMTELMANVEGPASHMYEVMVRQHFVSGVAGCSLALVFSAMFLIAARILWANDTNNKLAMHQLACVFVFLSAVPVAAAHTALLKTFNPEYYAIKDLISIVGGQS